MVAKGDSRGSRAAKRKGASWETAVVEYLKEHGFPEACRQVQGGTMDKGDVGGIPEGWVVEAKNWKKSEPGRWLDELEKEMGNKDAKYGMVMCKRYGHPDPGDAVVMMPGWVAVQLMDAITAGNRLNYEKSDWGGREKDKKRSHKRKKPVDPKWGYDGSNPKPKPSTER